MATRELLRNRDLSRVLRLTPSQRAELALALGRRCLDLLCTTRQITRGEARAYVRQARSRARRRP